MAAPADARRSVSERGVASPSQDGDGASMARRPANDSEIVVTRASEGFCARCGEPAGAGHECDRDSRQGFDLEPDRYCVVCGSRLTVQVLPQGVESECLRCKRRSRRSVA